MKGVYTIFLILGLIICYYGSTALAQQETKNIVSGTIKSIDMDKKELVLESKDATSGKAQETTLKIDDTTEIEYGLVLDDLIVGDELNVEFATDDAGNKIAKSIRFIEEESLEEEEITEAPTEKTTESAVEKTTQETKEKQAGAGY